MSMYFHGINHKAVIDTMTPEQMFVLHCVFTKDESKLSPNVKGLYEITKAKVAEFSQQELIKLGLDTMNLYGIKTDCPF